MGACTGACRGGRARARSQWGAQSRSADSDRQDIALRFGRRSAGAAGWADI